MISGGSRGERGSVGVQAGRSAGLAGKQRSLCAGGDQCVCVCVNMRVERT